MAITNLFDFEARMKSARLLAEVMGNLNLSWVLCYPNFSSNLYFLNCLMLKKNYIFKNIITFKIKSNEKYIFNLSFVSSSFFNC